MTFRDSWRCLALVCSLFLLGTALAADKPAPPKPSPEAIRARKIAEFTPTFKEYVFHGETFPRRNDIPSGQPAGVDGVKITFYDREYQPVAKATAPGVYGAVAEINVDGRKSRRFVTLYRTNAKMDAKQRIDPAMPDDVVRALAIEPAALKQQAKQVRDTLGTRTFGEWSRDPKAARLLAGLAQSKGDMSKPIHKYDDAFALDRQWWVGFQRRLYGWDKMFPRPFVAPRPRAGEPARVVRAGTAKEAGMKDDAADKIDKALQAFAADTDQAFAVCIVRHGVIVLHKAYGMREDKPMTVQTKSWMASVTKTMSATLMLMLVDQGLVKLDDPVDKFLPPLRGIRVTTPLTIHHLYTHTNGLTLYDWWPGWNDEMPDITERLSDYYDRLLVGKEWAYTGTGNILGGKIIEAVSGETVPRFYHRHLLEPLGCDHTDVVGTHADAFSVPLDMAKFGQMLLNGGSYGKWEFFRNETFQLMLPQKLTKLLGPEARSFGFGLDGTPKKFGHGAASAATFHVDTEADLVVIMTRNKYGKNQDKYNGPFWQALQEGMLKP
jgi:CubicO group peptidase (beta-lactamase class C family)